MFFSVLTVLATAASTAVAYGPGPGWWYTTPGRPGDGWEFATTKFFIAANSTRRNGHYAASQYHYTGHDVQYFGIQPHDVNDKRGTNAHVVYSVFGKGSTIGDPDRCIGTADGGAGVSCSLNIDLDFGRWYTIESAVVDKKADGTRRWNGTLVDDAGKRTYIASFVTDATYQGLNGIVANWLEWFPYNVDKKTPEQRECQPWFQVHYSRPQLTDDKGVVAQSVSWATAPSGNRTDDKCAVAAKTPNWKAEFQADKSLIITAGILNPQ